MGIMLKELVGRFNDFLKEKASWSKLEYMVGPCLDVEVRKGEESKGIIYGNGKFGVSVNDIKDKVSSCGCPPGTVLGVYVKEGSFVRGVVPIKVRGQK